MIFLAASAALLGALAWGHRVWPWLDRALLVKASAGTVAAGLLLLCQPWGFLFYLDPFQVNRESPFWEQVHTLCLQLYSHAFGVLLLGVVAFMAAVHLPKKATRE